MLVLEVCNLYIGELGQARAIRDKASEGRRLGANKSEDWQDEAGQWKSMVFLVRTIHYTTLIPVLCADRNRNSPQSCW